MSNNFPYQINSADKKFTLPADLNEISGLSYLSSGKIACVQDEQGTLFIYDTEKSEVINTVKFAGAGDYEGIEVIKNNVYVITSAGKIFSFTLDNPSNTKEIETPLKRKNDVEGLGYNPENNSLLIVCKADAEVNGNGLKGKAVYEYSISENRFNETPVLTLNTDDIESGKINKIKPSGIAVHPETKEVYLLASSHQLFIFKESKLTQTIKLDPSVFEQPEGICFSDKGTLYLSSEGKFGSGYILKFKPKK